MAALAVAALLAGASAARSEPADVPSKPPQGSAGELDALRAQAVAAARAAQQEEHKTLDIAHQLDLLRRDADGRQRGLDESRAEQAELLGIIERLARNPPDAVLLGSLPPLDRARAGALIAATLPELRTEAHALAEDIERASALRGEIAAKQAELGREGDALRNARAGVADMAARCLALSRKLAPQDAESDKRIAKLGREAADLGELVKRSDAEAERRNKDLPAKAKDIPAKSKGNADTLPSGDPTRPGSLRVFDADNSMLTMPVSGVVAARFGKRESPEKPRRGMELESMPGGVVVAPFDGQVVYAGPFRDYGPTLILRHDGGYHSILAGLGRLDVGNGQWVVAGEPVGAMPDTASDGSDSKLYIELLHDSRPVDPQPWLAKADDAAGRGQSGEQRVRE